MPSVEENPRHNCCQMTFRESDGGETKKVGGKNKTEEEKQMGGLRGNVKGGKEKSWKREKKVAMPTVHVAK